MGNGPVEGAVTCTVKHKKVFITQKRTLIFFWFFAENVRLLFLNIIKLIPLGALNLKKLNVRKGKKTKENKMEGKKEEHPIKS